ncbi:MAG: thioesterase family protein [Anaerolineales bacterium]|nr:thioesterase family protein [Anaerolineales bacterium]
MDVTEFVQPGMKKEIAFEVKPQHSAVHVGSGSVEALATPVMIAFMERAARDLLAECLPDGYSSVGVHVDVHHLAPTPLGGAVRVACEVLDVDGRRVAFAVSAWDAHEQIGDGQHQRVVIDLARFLQRLEAKQA